MIANQQEFLLAVTAIGIYLWDSAKLLHFNEGVLELDPSMRWRLYLGMSSTTVGGKYLYIPNAFAPHRPGYRLAWRTDDCEMRESTWAPEAPVLRRMSPLIWCVAIGTFLVFPLSLAKSADLGIILFALCGIYAPIATMLAIAWLTREELGLSNRTFTALAFECLVCPPCAVNLVRKIAHAKPVPDDLMMAAKRLLDSTQWETAKAGFISRLDDAFDQFDDDDARSACLTKRQNYLRSEATA